VRRARDKETARWTVAGIDVRDLARACWMALGMVVDEFFPRRARVRMEEWSKRLPTVTLRRRGLASSRGTSGYAHGGREATLLIGVECDQAKLRELVVHELAHCAHYYLTRSGDHRLDRPHGDTFNRLMVNAAARLWGVTVGIGSPGYGASAALLKALRAQQPSGPDYGAIVDHVAGLVGEATS
jgi:hypothetical protein